MADFDTAVDITLKNEGGYVNNPVDRGGPTNMGVTQADMPGVDMQTLTADQAKQYYREHYWKDLYSQISNQDVANKIFDMGVLFGVGTAVRMLQSILGVSRTQIFDSATLTAVNNYSDGSILPLYQTRLRIHVRWIVQQNPSQSIFLDGWLNRINS